MHDLNAPARRAVVADLPAIQELVVATWEREHGAFTDEELAAARSHRRMTALVFHTGALIALDRNDRPVWAMLRKAADDSAHVSVPAGVIAQAWRDGSRQALLARALTHCDEAPLEGALACATGLLYGRAGTADIGDASVALVAAARSRTGPTALVTSGPSHLRHLLDTLDASVRLVPI